MQKIIINACFGGFSFSGVAFKRLIELGAKETQYNAKGQPVDTNVLVINNTGGEKISQLGNQLRGHPYCFLASCSDNKLRTDPLLIQVVEELGEKANGKHAKLKIVEIPDEIKWQIEEYDGFEHIAEEHRTWE